MIKNDWVLKRPLKSCFNKKKKENKGKKKETVRLWLALVTVTGQCWRGAPSTWAQRAVPKM